MVVALLRSRRSSSGERPSRRWTSRPSSPITKWSATVHRADRLAEFVDKGLRIATSSRPGPVMLAVPADLLGEEVHAPLQAPAEDPPRPAPGGAETWASPDV